MNSKLDPDDEFFIPDVSGLDWSKGAVPRIPSNKVLARFDTTLEAWPVIIATVEAGRSPRTLSLDMLDAAGCSASVSAGPRLERFARLSDGGPHPNDLRRSRRVAETT